MLGREVEVLREPAEFVAVGHLHPRIEFAVGDQLESLVHFAHRADQRPRQDGPEEQGAEEADRGERRHRERQEAAMRLEGRGLSDDSVL